MYFIDEEICVLIFLTCIHKTGGVLYDNTIIFEYVM